MRKAKNLPPPSENALRIRAATLLYEDVVADVANLVSRSPKEMTDAEIADEIASLKLAMAHRKVAPSN